MSESETSAPTLEAIFLAAGITGVLEGTIRENLDDEFRFSENPHEFTWVEWIEDARGVRYIQFADGRIGLPAFEFAHRPALGQDFVVAVLPNTDDPRLNDKIPTRIIPVGIVPASARRKARDLIRQHYGQDVEIPALDIDVWDAAALTRHDIAVDLTFREFEIRRGKKKGETRIGSSMPSGKRVELYTGGKRQRFGSRTPPLDESVRCLVKHERLSKVLVVWMGKTTAEADAEAAKVAPLAQVLKTGLIAAENRPELKDPFKALGLDAETATTRELRETARRLGDAVINTDDEALADPMALAMMEANYPFKPGDPKSRRAREEYIDDARSACFDLIRKRSEAKPAAQAGEASGDAGRAAHDAGGDASAAAASDAPSNGGGKPTFEKPFGPRMGLPRLRKVAGELGVEVAEDADKPAVLAALEAKWLETHPQA